MQRTLLLAAAITAGIDALAQEVCTFEPEYLHEGDTVTLGYDPEASFLKGEIEGVYYFWRDYRWDGVHCGQSLQFYF